MTLERTWSFKGFERLVEHGITTNSKFGTLLKPSILVSNTQVDYSKAASKNWGCSDSIFVKFA